MATIHYKVRFEKEPPTLEALRARVQQRTGLGVALGKDSIDAGHVFPDLGAIREAGSLECDEAGDTDLDVTVGANVVRVDCVPGLNVYFRDSVLAALADLGGKGDKELVPHVEKKWAELLPKEREEKRA